MFLSLADLIALITLALWPAVPLFWVPVHCAPQVFRKLGLFAYVLPFLTWLPAAAFIISRRSFLLQYHFSFPLAVHAAGGLLLVLGMALQIRTLALLTLPGIMGVPEVTEVKGRLVTGGPFSVVRHPTYLSHTLMLLGVFLATGVASTGVVTVLDILVVNTMIIPLEERELTARFGEEYEEYRKKVPSRFLPGKRVKP
jgi:protein-S-isoprenylcysteine O-methyltransferase Ste14